MFERYTEKARRVIFFARYEASQFGAPLIEPEHLLLGLLREDRTLLERLAPQRPISNADIRRQVESRAAVQEKIQTSVELPLASGTKRALAYAHEESERLQHRHIGTEHLLLGLLREEGCAAAEILKQSGLSLDELREEIAKPATSASPNPLSALVGEIESCGRRLTVLTGRLSHQLGLKDHPILQDSASKPLTDKEDAGSRSETEMSRSGASVKGPGTVLGLEKLLRERVGLLSGARVGLVCNQSSVDHSWRHAADLFYEHKAIKLTALFGPQHGIRGDVQDNMVETAHAVDSATGLPVYSLYSETREPTEEMLKGLDVLVFDMQDVGCRIYTFIYTLANCMRAAQRFGKKVIVCDRPNPIAGVAVAGTVLDPTYASFVGQFPIATRHGMTVCELALMFKEHFGIDCELETVLMEGWSRELWMDETDAPWVMPSPNMPTLETATVFPGTVHLEGTQMSEGRGTTRPFELLGAPYIEARDYARRLNGLGLPGLFYRETGFQPTFQKHAGRSCLGVQIHVTNREVFEPVIAGVATVKLAYDLYADHFRWKEPPYEYVYDKNPFDVIAGTNVLREAIERGDTLEEIAASWREPLSSFQELRAGYLCY
jgi:uncharacterized protein YbbC (DUF1343 family)